MIRILLEWMMAASYMGLFLLGLTFFTQSMSDALKVLYRGYKRVSAHFQRRK